MDTLEFRLLPEQASTLAPRVDALYFFLVGITVFFSTLIAVLVVYFAVRYRRRLGEEYPRPVHPSNKLEIVWSTIPLAIVLVIFLWGADVYFALSRPPDDALEVFVVGRQWMWKIQHPDGQREINSLHIPVGQPVKLTLTSEDVIHSFYVPAFRTKMDAVPGRYTTTWFEATRPGRYKLFCTEYCGTEHSKMVGEVVVLKQADYQAWLELNAEGSMALKGRKLFSKLQCVTCHTGDAEGRGPSLEEIYKKRVPLQDGGSALADETYLRESILRPAAKIVAGYRPIMPTYQGQVNEEELLQLIAFLRGLGRGQTPPRVEDTPPPEANVPVEERKEKP